MRTLKLSIVLVMIAFITIHCKKQTADVLPPVVETGIYDGNITIVGQITYAGPGLKYYGHVWDTIPSPTLSRNTGMTQFSSGNDTIPITSTLNLMQGKTYYVRAYWIDPFDNEGYGADEITIAPSGNVQASFSIPTGTYFENCTPVQFVNNSTGANAYLWDFGDSNTSTDPNPTHIYENAGIVPYTVTLTAKLGSLEDVATQNITIDEAEKFLKSTNTGEFYAVLPTTDGYIMAGQTGSDAYYIETDKNGNPTVNFEQFSNGRFNDVIATVDGGFLLIGTKDNSIYFVKRGGASSFEKAVLANATATSGIAVDDGYVIAGQRNGDAIALSTNLNGEMVYGNWVRDFSNGQFNSIIVDDTDGNYVMAGYLQLSGIATGGYVVKISSNLGSTIWEKYFQPPYYPSSYETKFTCIANTSDGHYLVGGSERIGLSEPMARTYKISSNDCPSYFPCTPIWTSGISGYGLGSSRFNALAVSSNGNYTFAGFADTGATLEFKPIMVALEDNTSSGSQVWTTVVQVGAGKLNDIALTDEACGFITVGESSNNFLLIKTDAEGNAM